MILHWKTHFPIKTQQNYSTWVSWACLVLKFLLLLSTADQGWLMPPPPPPPLCTCLSFGLAKFGAHLTVDKEQISTQYSFSFWMNDQRSQLPGSLHQTWPTLIINDRGGQCPIFVAESSVMPSQTKPPVSSFLSIVHTTTEKKLFNKAFKLCLN